MYHDDERRRSGPDSLLWRYAGDTRIAFLGGTIGLLQLMHPAIGAGVLEHSNFFEDPFDRVFRSLPAILGAVYDEDADATGRWVRDQHRTIKGADAEGRPLPRPRPRHLLVGPRHVPVHGRAGRRPLRRPPALGAAEREQLYQEGITWYRRYGVSDRAVPPTRADFQVEWDRVCAEVLEMNEAVRYVLEHARPAARASSCPARSACSTPCCAAGRWPASLRVPVAHQRHRRAAARRARAVRHPVVARRPAPARRARARRPQGVAVRAVLQRWQPRAQDGWQRVRAEDGGDGGAPQADPRARPDRAGRRRAVSPTTRWPPRSSTPRRRSSSRSASTAGAWRTSPSGPASGAPPCTAASRRATTSSTASWPASCGGRSPPSAPRPPAAGPSSTRRWSRRSLAALAGPRRLRRRPPPPDRPRHDAPAAHHRGRPAGRPGPRRLRPRPRSRSGSRATRARAAIVAEALARLGLSFVLTRGHRPARSATPQRCSAASWRSSSRCCPAEPLGRPRHRR